jgi:uridine kinase
MTRPKVLSQLAASIVSVTRSHPLRVAIDGIDTSGKTTLADELVPLIEQHGKPVIRATIDGFHRPRRIRYQRGADSPEGYYEDSFDYSVIRDVLLTPLGPGGSLHYRRAIFDVHTDTLIPIREDKSPLNAILLFDGVFLMRPELAALWDYRIFVDVTMEVALQRAMRRDLPFFASPDAVRAHYLQRYFPGQQLYFQVVHPT